MAPGTTVREGMGTKSRANEGLQTQSERDGKGDGGGDACDLATQAGELATAAAGSCYDEEVGGGDKGGGGVVRRPVEMRQRCEWIHVVDRVGEGSGSAFGTCRKRVTAGDGGRRRDGVVVRVVTRNWV
jgi:hypothetical protein